MKQHTQQHECNPTKLSPLGLKLYCRSLLYSSGRHLQVASPSAAITTPKPADHLDCSPTSRLLLLWMVPLATELDG